MPSGWRGCFGSVRSRPCGCPVGRGGRARSRPCARGRSGRSDAGSAPALEAPSAPWGGIRRDRVDANPRRVASQAAVPRRAARDRVRRVLQPDDRREDQEDTLDKAIAELAASEPYGRCRRAARLSPGCLHAHRVCVDRRDSATGTGSGPNHSHPSSGSPRARAASGERRRQGGITKTGNAHARRLLIESCLASTQRSAPQRHAGTQTHRQVPRRASPSGLECPQAARTLERARGPRQAALDRRGRRRARARRTLLGARDHGVAAPPTTRRGERTGAPTRGATRGNTVSSPNRPRSTPENGPAPHLAHPVMRHQPAHMSRDASRRRQPMRSPRRTDPAKPAGPSTPAQLTARTPYECFRVVRRDGGRRKVRRFASFDARIAGRAARLSARSRRDSRLVDRPHTDAVDRDLERLLLGRGQRWLGCRIDVHRFGRESLGRAAARHERVSAGARRHAQERGSCVRGWRPRAAPIGGSTRSRRSRTCIPAASRTSRRRGRGQMLPPGSGRGKGRRARGSASRSRQRAAGSTRSSRASRPGRRARSSWRGSPPAWRSGACADRSRPGRAEGCRLLLRTGRPRKRPPRPPGASDGASRTSSPIRSSSRVRSSTSGSASSCSTASASSSAGSIQPRSSPVSSIVFAASLSSSSANRFCVTCICTLFVSCWRSVLDDLNARDVVDRALIRSVDPLQWETGRVDAPSRR